MTEPTRKNAMDETPPDAPGDERLDDDELIDLTQMVEGSADFLDGEGLELELDDGITDSSTLPPVGDAPDSDEDDDEIVELSEAFLVDEDSEGDGLEPDALDDELIDLSDMIELVDEGVDAEPDDLDEELVDLSDMVELVEDAPEGGDSIADPLGDETIDLSDMAELLDDVREEDAPAVDALGDETIDLSDMAELLDEIQEDEAPAVDALGDETIDLSDMAELLDEIQEDEAPAVDTLGDETIDLSDMAGELQDESEEMGLDLEGFGHETIDLAELPFLDEMDDLLGEVTQADPDGLGDAPIDLTEISSLLEEELVSDEEDILDLGEETLQLSVGLDDLGLKERGEVTTDDIPLSVATDGADDGLVDIDLLLASSDDEEGYSASTAEEGLLEELPDETLMLSDDDGPLFDLGAPLGEEPVLDPEAGNGEGLLDGFPDETLVLSDDDEETLLDLGLPLEDEPLSTSDAAPDEGVLDDLMGETVVLSDEVGELQDLPEVDLVPDEEGPGVLDLSDLVDEQGAGDGVVPEEPSKQERRPPGFPAGTFDLSEINDEPVGISAEEVRESVSLEGLPDISDEQLERVVERVVRTMFKERIEEMIVDAIGKNLSEDIEKMKKTIQDNFS